MIGVTGASGQLGGAVLRHLAGRLPSGQRLIAMTHAPARAPALVSLADEVRQAGFAAPETLPSAFEGLDTLLVVSVEGRDEDRIEWHRNTVRAAVAAGVRRVLYTSFLDVDPASPSSVAALNQPVRYCSISDEEQAVELAAQGLDHTLIERRVAYGRAIRGGFMTTLTDDFQRLVGRDPTAVADLVRAIDLTLNDH